MAAPNLVNVSTITAKSVQAALTTTLTTEILANASSSGKVFKINNIIMVHLLQLRVQFLHLQMQL